VEFLKRNLETDICGNHLMKNIRCLMWASMFFDGAYAHRLSQLAENLLRWQLPIQFSEDGVHFELSPAYHCQVFGDLLECLAVASESVRLLLMSFLERAAQALVDLTHPDGRISLMSDGGLNMVYPPSEYLRVFRRQGGLPPSPRSHFAFPDAGYYGFRSRRSYLLFDCGPACAESLPAHGHADILAVEWDADGQRFIVDAGVYQYENGAARIRSRSVISHNTLQVGDRDQLELVGSFRTGRRSHGVCDINEPSRDGVILQGHHAGFSMTRQEVVHQRLINAEDRSLRIRDSVIGTASENAVGRLLLHDQCGIADMCDRRLELRRGDTRVQLTSTVPLKVVDAAWSPDFGQLIPTKCVEFSLGNVPCRSDVCLKIV
jgi:uncharacterized heparinase superfamily protein